MTKRQKIILAAILFLALFLIFFRLGRHDLLGDDGHYALRAYGYFDYMASPRQTTPVQWFGERPAWSYLSFHDHPPMYFFTQHIFFKIFGASVTVSRLTSALAALGAVAVMFFLGRRYGDPGFGLLAAGALVLNNYFIWTGRIGNLESLFIFWLLLALLYLDKALRDSPKYFRLAALFLGFTMLTKYTLLFFLPAVFLYLLWKEKQVFRTREFWLGIGIFLLVISPLFLYNLKMYGARGHFDVQWSDFFGQQHEDWTALQSRVGGWHFHARDMFRNLADGLSWPYALLAILGLAMALYHGRRERRFYLVSLLFLLPFLFFLYIGGAAHWLAVMSPVAALLTAIFWQAIWQHRPAAWAGGILALYLLVVVWNTNHASTASANQYFTSSLRVENYGYRQLDGYFAALLSGKSVPYRTRDAVRQLWFKNVKPEALGFLENKDDYGQINSLIVYDANASWFPLVWTLERWRIYNGVLTVSSKEFAYLLANQGLDIFNSLGLDRIYYVHAGAAVRQQSGLNHDEGEGLRANYESRGRRPEVIYDDLGREAFYIYETQTLNL